MLFQGKINKPLAKESGTTAATMENSPLGGLIGSVQSWFGPLAEVLPLYPRTTQPGAII